MRPVLNVLARRMTSWRSGEKFKWFGPEPSGNRPLCWHTIHIMKGRSFSPLVHLRR